MIGGSLWSTDGKELVSDKGIRLGYTYGKVLGTILRYVDGITLGIDIGTELGFLDESVYGSNNGKLEGLLIGDSLGSTDGKVFGSDESTAIEGLTWLRVHVMVVVWMFVSVGCHARSIGAELICEIDYAI